MATLVYATRKKIVVKTSFDFHRLLDRAEVVKKSIDDFNNSVHRSMKYSKKVVEIFID